MMRETIEKLKLMMLLSPTEINVEERKKERENGGWDGM